MLHDVELNPGPVQPRKLHKLKCLYLNSRSINNKIRDIEAMENTNAHDLIAITETWLKPSIDNCELFQGNVYQILRRDREHGVRGGGVMHCLLYENLLSRYVDKT